MILYYYGRRIRKWLDFKLHPRGSFKKRNPGLFLEKNIHENEEKSIQGNQQTVRIRIYSILCQAHALQTIRNKNLHWNFANFVNDVTAFRVFKRPTQFYPVLRHFRLCSARQYLCGLLFAVSMFDWVSFNRFNDFFSFFLLFLLVSEIQKDNIFRVRAEKINNFNKLSFLPSDHDFAYDIV